MRPRGRERTSTAVSSWLPAGAPYVFNPLDLSPALWLDASDTTTITESSGSVSEWRDKSGNGRHVAQATGANQPTTAATTRNSLNVLDFNGSSDRLVAATASDWTFLHSAQSTVFTVFRAGNTTDPEAFYAVWATSVTSIAPVGAYLAHDTRSSAPRNDALVHVVGPISGANNRVFHDQQNQLAGNVWAQTTVIGDIDNATVANRSTIRLNGGSDLTSTWTGAVATNTNAPRHAFTVGAGQGSTNVFTFFLLGSVAEVVVYQNKLSAANITVVENYLSTKWDL